MKAFPGTVYVLMTILLASSCAGIANQQKNFVDPFEYCAAAGNADSPWPPYSGPALPGQVIEGLNKSMNAGRVPLDVLKAGIFWRCMDGKVYACFTGANIPCTARADTTKTPDVEMLKFCTEKPDSDVIPSHITGRFTVFQWRCRQGLPEALRQVLHPDARGFVAEYWHEIKPGK